MTPKLAEAVAKLRKAIEAQRYTRKHDEWDVAVFVTDLTVVLDALGSLGVTKPRDPRCTCPDQAVSPNCPLHAIWKVRDPVDPDLEHWFGPVEKHPNAPAGFYP